MAFNWDSIIGIVIVIVFILIIWSKITKQTVKEVVMDIKDMFSGGSEEVEERVGGVIEYE